MLNGPLGPQLQAKVIRLCPLRYQKLIIFFICFITLVMAYKFYTYEQISTFSENEQVLTDRPKPQILMWTRVFGKTKLFWDASCPLFHRCNVTDNRDTLPDSSAVVYHLPDVNDFPKSSGTFDGPLNVLMTQESYLNYIEFLKRLPEHYFHWVMTFVDSAHIPFPYSSGRWQSPEVAKTSHFHPEYLPFNKSEIMRNKSRKVFWIVSNCQTPAKRELAVKALQRFIDVDIYGKCATNASFRDACPKSGGFNCDFFNFYHFMIIAENSICNGYVTEKYWSRYHLPVVPIVMRRYVYESILPSHSFIAMDDFDGPKALAKYLHSLMRNTSEYLRYFQWRSEGWARPSWNAVGYRTGMCKLCEMLLELKNVSQVPRIANVSVWLRDESHCERGEFAARWANTLDDK